jgi:leucyl aminopeptidase
VFSHLVDDAGDARPIWPVTEADYPAWRSARPAAQQRWLDGSGFQFRVGRSALLPAADGGVDGLLLCVGEGRDLWRYAGLPAELAVGRWRIAADLNAAEAIEAATGWLLGTYAFRRYKTDDKTHATLLRPPAADRARVERFVRAISRARDLITTPAADLGPAELAAAVAEVGAAHGAKVSSIVGDELIAKNWPMVHAVGRASARPPHLIDLTWGDATAPKVTLVGKGVCFDSGGLDLKTAAGMLMMKKDMGGAATVLAVAELIMGARLPVRLRLLIPAVENAVSGTAFRPGDVLKTRAGKTVEIGNTDAEGRLILGDALAEADSERPQLIIDVATLTGAARVALGPELPAMFTPDDALAADLARHGQAEGDPMWRMPLWPGYRVRLDSKVADMNNSPEGGMAGSVTAALFLQAFVPNTKSWVHLDSFAWSDKARPGRPIGGEPLTARTLYALIEERFAR